MRALNPTQKHSAVSALADQVEQEDHPEVEALKAKVEYLRSILRGLLIRSPSDRKTDVKLALQELDKIPTQLQLQAFVDSYYNPVYFMNEPDIDFKLALASALDSYMRLRVPTYNNPLFRSIAEQSLSAGNLLRNFIED